MKAILQIILFSFLATSCMQKEMEEDKYPILFSSSVDAFTKGVSTTNTFGPINASTLRNSSDGFVVCSGGLGTKGNMDNVNVKFKSGVWTYSGDYFWPANSSSIVTFTAYAPAGAPAVTLTGNGLTVANFIQSLDTAKQIDLVYAPKANFSQATSGKSGVVLNFKHLLTQVVFTVIENCTGKPNLKIMSIALTVPKSEGSYNGTFWTEHPNRKTYTVFSGNVIKGTGVTSSPIFMIPQNELNNIDALITLSIDGKTRNKSVDLGKLNGFKSWIPGNKVTYTITINDSSLKSETSIPNITISAETSERIPSM